MHGAVCISDINNSIFRRLCLLLYACVYHCGRIDCGGRRGQRSLDHSVRALTLTVTSTSTGDVSVKSH